MNDSDYRVEYITSGNLGSCMVVRYRDSPILRVREYDENLARLARKARKAIRQHRRAVRTLAAYEVKWGEPKEQP